MGIGRCFPFADKAPPKGVSASCVQDSQLVQSDLQYHLNIGLRESMTDNKYTSIYNREKKYFINPQLY
jgi:hypothetical protein